MTSTAITARSTATSGRAASTPGSTSTCAPRRASRNYRAFMEEAADLCVSYGGSLSGEHGDGQQRAELLSKQYGEELLTGDAGLQADLGPRLEDEPGQGDRPLPPRRAPQAGHRATTRWRPPVRFAYARTRATSPTPRCAVSGSANAGCPTPSTVMCPSYMVTREEKDSTRGRARLLFEMLQGDVITDGWQSREVYDALDLCLSCKGCTNDCPVKVDMPTYKAEFLHHHFKSARRWRPRYAYAFGLIDQAARVASRCPSWSTSHPDTGPLPHGEARRRDGDRAPDPLVRADHAAAVVPPARRDSESPRPAGRAVARHVQQPLPHRCRRGLRRGHRSRRLAVVIPEGHVCCGRPLYDYGFLDLADATCAHDRRLRDEIRQELPGRNGAELPGGVQRRAHRMLPHDDERRPAGAQRHALRRVLRALRDPGPAPRGEKRSCGATAITRQPEAWTPSTSSWSAWVVDVEPDQRRMLRTRRLLGLRAGPLRHLDAVRRAGAASAVRDADRDTLVIATASPAKPRSKQSGTGRRALTRRSGHHDGP